MGLHLNLYHEISKEKLAKARDPLKLSIIALGFIASCLAGYYFVQLGVMSGISHENARKRDEFSRLEPLAKAAVTREEALVASTKISGLLVKRIEERFYWAPVLEEIGKLVPPNLQLTRFSGEIVGDNRRCVLTLDGVASGEDPRKTAEELRTALAASFGAKFKEVSSLFRTLEDAPETVTVAGKQWPLANFSIAVQFVSGEEDAPAPVAPRRKSR